VKYFSLFSGIGGFELGIQQAMPNAQCVGFSEINKYAVSIYKKHFKEHENYGDANKINAEKIPDFDCLVGGFPCQSFSVAGKRKGFDDKRGVLFFDIVRILKANRPKLCVLENVKGLISSDGGESFKTIIGALDELGYDVQWQVLNSKNHGVAQHRERVFIVGHLRASGQSARKIFPFRSCSREIDSVSGQEVVSPALTTKQEPYRPGAYIIETKQQKENEVKVRQLIGGSQANRIYDPNGLAVTQSALGGGGGAKTGLYFVCFNAERGIRDKDTNPNRGGGSGMLSRDDGMSYALTQQHAAHFVMPCLTPNKLKIRQKGRRFKSPGEPAFTINAQDQHGVIVDGRIRKLMPIECERLQGFPDLWTKWGDDGKEISDTQRYKCIGNAVTVNVVAEIFRRLKP